MRLILTNTVYQPSTSRRKKWDFRYSVMKHLDYTWTHWNNIFPTVHTPTQIKEFWLKLTSDSIITSHVVFMSLKNGKKAIQAGHFKNFSVLTAKLTRKHLPKSMITIKVHAKLNLQNLLRTKVSPEITEDRQKQAITRTNIINLGTSTVTGEM